MPRLVESLLEVTHLSNSETADLLAARDEALAGPVPLIVDKRPLGGPEVFALYADGHFIGEDYESNRLLRKFSLSPVLIPHIQWTFHAYCRQVYEALSWLYDIVRNLESSGQLEVFSDEPVGKAACIYCLSTSGSFSSVEHVYPEALGNENITLAPGIVCDSCNNGLLSVRDRYLVEQDVVAFLRVLYVPFNTKNGKYLKAANQRFTIQRFSPRDLLITPHGISRKELRRMEKEGEMALELVSRRPFDPVELARSLFKIGLGLVAFHQGHESALHKRYDEARAFIAGKSGIATNLITATSLCPKREAEGLLLVREAGTFHFLNLYGWKMAYSLESTPPLPDEVRQEFADSQFYWLGDKDEQL